MQAAAQALYPGLGAKVPKEGGVMQQEQADSQGPSLRP